MKTQFRDPDGMLNCLHNIITPETDRVFLALADACESYDICMIKRNNTITPRQKAILMELASSPLSLAHQIRLYVRKMLREKLPDSVTELPLPPCLQKYLIYDYNM